MKTLLLGTLASCFLLLPMQADDRDHRYYDRQYHDYHTWNDREASAYHRYWTERRQKEIAWERANERQRREYWRWRHDHP